MRELLIFFFLFLFQTNIKAQSFEKDEFQKPEWASLIDSVNVNYDTATALFNHFWKGKEEPVEEQDIFENAPSENETVDSEKLSMAGVRPSGLITDDLKKEMRYKAFLAFEYKRFKDWQQEVLPYVQPDGSLLSQQEKEMIWKKQKGN